MQAVGAARDCARLAVERLGATVREPGANVGEDAFELAADRGRELAEGLELRVRCLRGTFAELAPRRAAPRGLPPGKALHVKAVEDELRVGRGLGHRLDVRAGHVDGHGMELGDARVTELGEERLEHIGVLASARPDDLAAHMVDHDGDVLAVLAIRDFVHADVRQSIEQIEALVPLHDALDDVADGGPRNAHQVADRRLVAALREVADLVFERPGEPRADVGPGHVLDDDAAPGTVDAARVVTQVNLHPGGIEMPPPTARDAVVAAAIVTAARVARPPPGRRHVDLEAVRDEVASDDAGVFQPEQLVEQAREAHGGPSV